MNLLNIPHFKENSNNPKKITVNSNLLEKIKESKSKTPTINMNNPFNFRKNSNSPSKRNSNNTNYSNNSKNS